MCEILAVAWDVPRPFDEILPWARSLERIGIAGFGWGVGWLDDTGAVHRYRRPVSLDEDAQAARSLADVASTRFLVHLRRPSRLSTIQEADTQPFLSDDGGYAFCHNGLFRRADEVRGDYGERLRGRADSEVGFCFFQDRLRAGSPPGAAMQETIAELGGTGNLGYLGPDGSLVMLGGHPHNGLWRLRLGEAAVAVTGLHSDDESVFDLLFPDGTDRQQVIHEVTEVAGPTTAARPRAAS